MSVATELRSVVKPSLETRAVLSSAGNRMRVLEEPKKNKENLKKIAKVKKLVSEKATQEIVGNNVPVESRCSSPGSSKSGSSSSVGSVSSKRREKCNGRRKDGAVKSARTVPDGVEEVRVLVPVQIKRCDWITAFSDQFYISFHDEEWGIPVHDDRKLFELLVLSQALAEHTWPAILNKRDTFRKLFDNFDPSSVAKCDEKKLQSVGANHSTLLSEQKLRAIVENANQLLKVQQEFGSFSKYCWRFVNHKPMRNGFRYTRQVPAKTPKSEIISKDLMRRGFRCVGPTVVYSFMQVAGMVNDHLLACYRYNECNNDVQTDSKQL